VANVLPSLGERSVRQCTVLDLCVPKVPVTAEDDPEVARVSKMIRNTMTRLHAEISTLESALADPTLYQRDAAKAAQASALLARCAR